MHASLHVCGPTPCSQRRSRWQSTTPVSSVHCYMVVPNTEVLSRVGLPSMFTLLRQRRLRWLGHVHRMPDGRIPKDLLYGELATGSRRTGRPQLRYRDVVKRDMKAVGIDTETWENLAADRSQWRGAVTKHLKTGEDKLTQAAT